MVTRTKPAVNKAGKSGAKKKVNGRPRLYRRAALAAGAAAIVAPVASLAQVAGAGHYLKFIYTTESLAATMSSDGVKIVLPKLAATILKETLLPALYTERLAFTRRSPALQPAGCFRFQRAALSSFAAADKSTSARRLSSWLHPPCEPAPRRLWHLVPGDRRPDHGPGIVGQTLITCLLLDVAGQVSSWLPSNPGRQHESLRTRFCFFARESVQPPSLCAP